MAELHVDSKVISEKGALSAKSLVNNLVGEHDMAGLNLLFQRTDRPRGNNVGNAQRFQGINVGSIGYG